MEENDVTVLKMLKKALCMNPNDPYIVELFVPCNLEAFSSPDVEISYEAIGLHNSDSDSKFKPLVETKKKILPKLDIEILSYFPPTGSMDYRVLNPINWPLPQGYPDYGKHDIVLVGKNFGITDSNLANEWELLWKKISNDPDFCNYKMGKARIFWKHYLSLEMGPLIKKLIQCVLVTPIGSADAERGFSTLFHIRSPRRSTLSSQNLEVHMRIRLNGNRKLEEFPALLYAKKWTEQGGILSDDHHGTIKRSKNIEMVGVDDKEEEMKVFNKDTNIF